MYVCMWVCTCSCLYKNVCVCTYVCVHVWVCVHVHVCMRACKCIYVHTYVHTHTVFACVCVQACAHVCTLNMLTCVCLRALVAAIQMPTHTHAFVRQSGQDIGVEDQVGRPQRHQVRVYCRSRLPSLPLAAPCSLCITCELHNAHRFLVLLSSHTYTCVYVQR